MINRIAYEKLGEILHTYTHSSGLKVFIVKKEGYQKKTAIFATSYGSIDMRFVKPGDSADTVVPDGIAHFLEHKLFEQEDMNVLEKFSRLGASPNAFTSFHETAYHFTCTDKFEENFRLLLYFVQHPWLTEENVEKEKGIIGQEIRMYDDHADWRLFFNLLTCLYKDHPVNIDIAGTVESIAGITKDLLMDCWKTFYNPSNMAVAVVGDIEPAEITAIVDEMIEQKENVGRINKKYPVEEDGLAKEMIEQSFPVSMPTFMMGVRDDKRVAGKALLRRKEALSIALEGLMGRSSELYSRLYEEGQINESFSLDVMMVPAFGFATWGGQTSNPEKLAEILKNAVTGLVKTGIDESTYLRIRKAHEGQFIRSLNSSEMLARELVDTAFADASPFDMAEIFANITLAEVNACIVEVLSNPSAISIVRPIT